MPAEGPLRDFSIRTLTPLVIASVIANFSTQAIFRIALHENYNAIFTMPENLPATGFTLWHVGNVILLGAARWTWRASAPERRPRL